MSKEKDNTANHTHDHTHDHDHSHTHDHDHDHHHHDTQLPHEKWSTHYHAPGENHGAPGVNDYMKAVRDYRKTWPNKQKVMAETPDPAVRELLYRMEQMGCDTVFDRFDNQQPQCTFGIAGVCCKNCFMGPCRITEKAPRGVCGADADLIVARNMARAAAGGLTQHGAHARELLVALKKAITGEYDHPIVGTRRLIEVATAFGLETENREIKDIANDVADILIDDLNLMSKDDILEEQIAMLIEENKKQLVISSTVDPKSLEVCSKLQDRLQWGLTMSMVSVTQ